MSARFEVQAKKFTDKIIELAATEVAKIDDCMFPNHKSIADLVTSCRATLIAIRNNTLLLEDVVERAAEHKPVHRREPIDP